MSTIYNEIEPFAAQWLRNLAAAGHIAPGAVDERSISDLTPADVTGHGQRHSFAGIAGWSLALRLAGVPDTADVWTGSCPCQSLSSAGKRLGFADPRHLWPVWFGLIRECRPPVVFGEQVASALGWAWLDLVFSDLEGAGYACAAADLPACSVGAPHRRQRLFFVAYADCQRQQGVGIQLRERKTRQGMPEVGGGSETGRLAHSTGKRRNSLPRDAGSRREQPELAGRSEASGMADAEGAGRGTGRIGGAHGRPTIKPVRYGHDSWTPCEWIPCRDPAGGPPVFRPVEPGTHPLAHGVPGRVGLLRGYGNAISPPIAAAFIRAALEAL